MKKIKLKAIYRRATTGVITLVVGAGLLAPYIFLTGGVANAYVSGELEPRQIAMSTSAPGATSVTYTATFSAATTSTVAGMVIDFCANDPIPGDACTTGSGTLTGLAIATTDTTSLTGTWVGTSSTATKAVLTCSASCPSVTAGNSVTVTMTGVTNPTPSAYPGSFYARIFTFSTSAGATSYTSASPNAGGTIVDQGGDALSTAQTLNVQAKVIETLTFCVFSTSCGTAGTSKLGTSANEALSTTNTYGSSNVSYQLATNALSGVTVTMTGTTLCSAATVSYANCEGAGVPPDITAIGSTAAAAATGTSQFGMCADVANFAGLTPAATYKGNSGSNACPNLTEGTAYTPGSAPLTATTQFGFNDANSAGGTNAAGGSTVVSSSGPIVTATDYLTFIANIASTTPSGVYNANLNLVATGKF